MEWERNPKWKPGDPVRSIPLPVDMSFIRTPRWRYIWDHQERFGRLFDIQRDFFEDRNLSREERELGLRLRESLLRWREAMLQPWSRPSALR
jgi:hypothetical protein